MNSRPTSCQSLVSGRSIVPAQTGALIGAVNRLRVELPLSAADVRDGSCVTSIAGPHGGAQTVREMKEGPSGSAIRSLIPTPTASVLRSKAVVVSVAETSGQLIPAGKVERWRAQANCF